MKKNDGSRKGNRASGVKDVVRAATTTGKQSELNIPPMHLFWIFLWPSLSRGYISNDHTNSHLFQSNTIYLNSSFDLFYIIPMLGKQAFAL